MGRGAAWLRQGRLRARPDLVFVEEPAGAAPHADTVVVKDPLSLQYFRLGEHEHFLLRALRRPLSIDELLKRYRRRFPNEPTSGDRVLAFCAALFESSLLLSDQPGQAAARERLARGNDPFWARLLSPLAIRLPGVDPTPLLKPLEGFGRVAFGWRAAVVLAIAGAAVAIGLLGQAEELLLQLSRLTELWRPSYVLLAVAAVVAAKAWHELGHALACRSQGAECHDAGVLLLALLPCLYCDVSDAWTLTTRRRRALVALGGVYFEAMLAVAAGFAWLVLNDGPLRVLALYLIVVTTVSTLLINLNPLLRFDGYYVLADTWGVANLHEQSRRVLWGPLRRWVRGTPNEDEPLDAPAWALAAYALASTVYVLVLLTVILWGAHRALSEAGFAAAGDVLVALALIGAALATARAALGVLPKGPARRRLGGVTRLALLALIAAVALGGLGAMPIEQTLHSPFRLESVQAYDVVARSEGTLEGSVRYGDRVEARDLLARVLNPDDDLRRLELLEREAALKAELAGLRTRAQRDALLLSEVTGVETELTEARRQRLSHEAEALRRELRAPTAGRVLRPADREGEQRDESAEGELPTWAGAPLDPANDGCRLQPGETICRIVGEGVRAVVLLDQTDSGLVRVGGPVRLALSRDPSEVFTGVVESVALAANSPRAESESSAVESAIEESLRGALEARDAYRVTVTVSEPSVVAQPGAVGQARIVTGRETVAGRCLRWLRGLLRFG